MTYWDIIADTGAGLERVDIAATAAEATTTAAALAAAGALGITINERSVYNV